MYLSGGKSASMLLWMGYMGGFWPKPDQNTKPISGFAKGPSPTLLGLLADAYIGNDLKAKNDPNLPFPRILGTAICTGLNVLLGSQLAIRLAVRLEGLLQPFFILLQLTAPALGAVFLGLPAPHL